MGSPANTQEGLPIPAKRSIPANFPNTLAGMQNTP
jgi:hypothetical protein